MRLFLDANVLISVINKEYPLFTYSAKILSLEHKGYELFTSPVCIAIAFYFASKKSGGKVAKDKLSLLLDHIKITTTDHECTSLAVKNPQIHDVEDGIQYYSALKHKCSFIITEDQNDFYFSEIRVYGCEYFLKNELA